MRITEIMTRGAHTVAPSITVQEASRAMKRLNVGMMAVTDERGRLLGVVTDRDLVLRAMAEGLDPERTQIRAVMSHEAHAAYENTELGDAVETMCSRGISRLIVLNDSGEVSGVLSASDVAVHCDPLRVRELFRALGNVYRDKHTRISGPSLV
jgi:CBS domain-containing protein